MIRKYLLSTLVLIVTIVQANAQRSSVSTMHMLNPFQQVQAYGGFDKSISSTFMYRTQWAPVVNNPKYLHFNIHLPIYFLDGGAGILFEQEDLGVESNSSLKLSYNMVFQTGIGLLSGSATIGFQQKRFFGSQILTPEGVYEPGGQPNHNDPILNQNTSSSVQPTWALGALWKFDQLTTGLQIDNFFTPAFELDNLSYGNRPVLTLIADYQYTLSEEIKVIPSILAISNFKNLQLNLGILLNYGNIFGGMNMRGVTNNAVESLGIISGINFNQHYTIAYSYDLGLSALRNSSEGSHEIILKYNLNKIINTGLPPRVIYNPRDL